jgi:hypothetical protein
MLRKLAAYFLAGAGFLVFGFFSSYKGSLIAYPRLWMWMGIIAGIAGLWLLSSSKKRLPGPEWFKKQRLDRLRKEGEKILLTVDNCEIRENNYYEETINNHMSAVQQIDASYAPVRNYHQRYVEQSAIIYYYSAGDKKHRMTSEPFMINAETLKSCIEAKMVILYVNRHDKNDYAFDMPD